MMYHVTNKTNAEKILAEEGVNTELVGTEGGLQAGWGFYLAPDEDSAEYWQDRLFGLPTMQPAVLEVDVSGLKLLSREEVQEEYCSPEMRFALREWATEREYIVNGSFTATILERHKVDPKNSLSREGIGWTVFGLYLLENNIADGYYSQEDTVVILRPEKLIFNLVKR